MNSKSYYNILGVAPNATQGQIRRIYRKLARRFHPDVNHEPAAEERIKQIASAHETPIDRARHTQYNTEGQPPMPTPDPKASGQQGLGTPSKAAERGAVHECFVSPPAHRQQHRRGEDWHAGISIELADAYRSATRTLWLHRPGLNADGVLEVHDRVLEVNIPQGVRHGQILRLEGQGAPGQGGALAGDLYLRVAFHRIFPTEARPGRLPRCAGHLRSGCAWSDSHGVHA